MTNKTKKGILRTTVGFVSYALGLLALNYLDKNHFANSHHRYWLVLLPLLPTIYMAFNIIRSISELDEMMRKIQMEALAFAGVATGFTCFSYLFLRDMGTPEFHAEWAFYMLWFYYGIGTFFSRWRYR